MTIGLGVVCKTELQFGARYLEEFLPKLENKMRYQSLIIDLGIPYSLMVLFTNLSVIVLAIIKWLKVRKWDDLLNLSNYHNPFPNSYGGWVIKVKENSKILLIENIKMFFFYGLFFYKHSLSDTWSDTYSIINNKKKVFIVLKNCCHYVAGNKKDIHS